MNVHSIMSLLPKGLMQHKDSAGFAPGFNCGQKTVFSRIVGDMGPVVENTHWDLWNRVTMA